MTSERRRVVITGMGCVTAAGSDVEALWRSARDGISGVKPLQFEHMPPSRIKHAAQIHDFDASNILGPELCHRVDRFAALALVAAGQAVAQSGFADAARGDRCGVIIGSGVGGFETNEAGQYRFYVSKKQLDLLTIPKVMPSAAAAQISMQYGVKGPCFCISSACSSATQSIGTAVHLIRSGLIDAAIVGGSEALLTPACVRHWELLRVLTPTACRPFCKSRNGMVLGEGAGIMVIEWLEQARARGAPILAELAGYGTTSDAGDLLRPDIAGPTRAMALAIADAGLSPDAIDYVNAHGTGTVLNDTTEAQAIQHVFGACAGRLAVSSTKPIHGHALGAAGAIELIVTVRALQDQVAPPTINWQEADPACAIDAVPNAARPMQIRAALSNSFAFGGINASLLVQPAS